MKRFLFIILALLLITTGAFAADGDELTTTSFRVDSNGQVIMKQSLEAATTNDTVTAAESGKVFVLSPTSETTFTLPTAAAGLNYTFIIAAGSATAGKKVILSPQSTDQFVGCVSSTAATTFAAGDDLDSPATPATGDSVTIVGASTKWYCINRQGTWSDGN